MKPLIGISCSYNHMDGRFFLPEAYVEAVIKAQGIPLILPGSGSIKAVAPFFRAVRGLVLTGGGDVDPGFFDEEPLPGLGEVTPERDRFEIMLVRAAMQRRIPILGICRGIQILNVACGGSVIQHIPAEIGKPLKHSQSAPRWHSTHKVSIAKGSRLAEILKCNSTRVNSFHHQAVRSPAPGFEVTARSSDGVIEAIEHRESPFVIGVQWHPECMAPKDRHARLLIGAFTEAASRTDQSRKN
ncbi:gamma-glutamyl-gamma-aminobutyrate hydrolase family protein [Phosphitispora fastidiosa]|uniref:gamma-glutamyl-gamma-aminobutyrate hydrolase family protein n=1 Tax=Phosphitispora fastidiosa TaxID=2837202 RepID=UPI001E3667B3|nr:gamma-glutamyl-gamma-aminobutyrate hydrolase family protein [Phosphitispora fastidiosa]MBU7008424.1 putative glutamine amidotransferase [Phosphitispora fastidiosa]